MKRHFQLSASAIAVSFACLVYAFTAYSQQRGTTPAVPGAAVPAGARGQAIPGTETGWSTFQLRCASCHLNPAVDLATPGTVLRQMTPEKI